MYGGSTTYSVSTYKKMEISYVWGSQGRQWSFYGSGRIRKYFGQGVHTSSGVGDYGRGVHISTNVIVGGKRQDGFPCKLVFISCCNLFQV